MEVLKIGSKGDAVRSLQILLNNHGFVGTVDGFFGPKTEDSVIAFQTKSDLTADGIVGRSTWSALLENNDTKKINKSKYVLTSDNYYPQPFSKQNIVLHHTNGWTVRKGSNDSPSMNHFNWWTSYWGEENGRAKVATAYSIDHKGNIYEHFDPQMWAYHLGLGRKRNYLDKKSIGIELVNEGSMIKKGDKFYWVTGKNGETHIPYNRMQYEPVKHKEWRGYEYFAPYTELQMESTVWLTKYLCEKYNIKKNIIEDCDYHEEIISGAFEGIYNHSNVRTDKWDLSPIFDFKYFKKEIAS